MIELADEAAAKNKGALGHAKAREAKADAALQHRWETFSDMSDLPMRLIDGIGLRPELIGDEKFTFTKKADLPFFLAPIKHSQRSYDQMTEYEFLHRYDLFVRDQSLTFPGYHGLYSRGLHKVDLEVVMKTIKVNIEYHVWFQSCKWCAAYLNKRQYSIVLEKK